MSSWVRSLSPAPKASSAVMSTSVSRQKTSRRLWGSLPPYVRKTKPACAALALIAGAGPASGKLKATPASGKEQAADAVQPVAGHGGDAAVQAATSGAQAAAFKVGDLVIITKATKMKDSFDGRRAIAKAVLSSKTMVELQEGPASGTLKEYLFDSVTAVGDSDKHRSEGSDLAEDGDAKRKRTEEDATHLFGPLVCCPLPLAFRLVQVRDFSISF